MSWINEHKGSWRITFLALLLIALSGPWFFDRIHVPAQYPCSFPNFRLEGDFCGTPMTGLWIFLFAPGGLYNAAVGLFTQSMDFATSGRVFLGSLLLLLLLLPFLSTLSVSLRAAHRRWRLFHIIVLGLAAASAGLVVTLFFPQPHRALWGIWLYISLVVSMLLLEVLALYGPRGTVD